MPEVLFMDRSPIVVDIVSAHNKKSTHKDLSDEGLYSYYSKTNPTQSPKAWIHKDQMLCSEMKPMPCCMPVQLVVQLSSSNRVSAKASALQAICCITDNKSAKSSSKPCHCCHTGIWILPLQSKGLSPLQLHEMKTPGMHSNYAKAFFFFLRYHIYNFSLICHPMTSVIWVPKCTRSFFWYYTFCLFTTAE